MKAIMVMFDSLNRHYLPPYGGREAHAPNFARLAQRAATFDTSYVCSMPCMPARRDLHTGRPSFLHTAWGPLEPFDDSVPAMLSEAGVYTHLASDHYHYWEDGGATYHSRYDSWEFYRGQEGDTFIGQVAEPRVPEHINGKQRRSDWVNREHIRTDAQYPQTQTFEAGLRFIERNHDQDNWFLQIECFDPHEPFVCDRRYKDRYSSDYDGPLFDWPGYEPVKESPEQVEEAKRNYKALLSKCDASLGDVLDAMDAHGLWDDTMLILWTDHGFMLGEHDCWAKNWMPLYEQVAHTPFFVWDPRHAAAAGQRRRALVQPAIDLGPTLLGFFGLEPTSDMRGRDLAPVLADDTPVRDAAIFGYHGQAVNLTDGRYVYMRQNANEGDGPLNQYTLMPVRMRRFKEVPPQTELAGPLPFTKDMPVLKLPVRPTGRPKGAGEVHHRLYDLQRDPEQAAPIEDASVEQRLCERMSALMADCDAPAEAYERLGLTPVAV